MTQLVKNLPAIWETSVRSLGWVEYPGEGKVYPIQCSGLENSLDCIVHRVVVKSWSQLSDLHFHYHFHKVRNLTLYRVIFSYHSFSIRSYFPIPVLMSVSPK